jgi:dipeptidyl aminopeptidase/acylaminoacyl peptidase
MLIEPDIKAGVIWAGAVYSYDDFARYTISDPSFVRTTESPGLRRSREIFERYGSPNTATPFWQLVSLTENIDMLESPLQIHHSATDDVVNIGYSIDLANILQTHGKTYEFYQYVGGGHNISSPYFETAMQRTIAFFQQHL